MSTPECDITSIFSWTVEFIKVTHYLLCLTDLSVWTEMEGMGNGGNQGLAIFDWQQVQSVIWEAEPGMLGDGCYAQCCVAAWMGGEFRYLHQFSSVAQSCPTLCDPMNRSMPGLPVHHQLREFTQTQVHRVSDAIQPSHPLSSPSSPGWIPLLVAWNYHNIVNRLILQFKIKLFSFFKAIRGSWLPWLKAILRSPISIMISDNIPVS